MPKAKSAKSGPPLGYNLPSICSTWTFRRDSTLLRSH